MEPGGSFYATFFERPKGTPVDYVVPSNRGKPFFTEKNVFLYFESDLKWAASFGPWEYRYIGDWGHPANQKMVQFVRLTDAEVVKRAQAAEAAPEERCSQGRSIRAPTTSRELKRVIKRGRRWAARKLDPH